MANGGGEDHMIGWGICLLLLAGAAVGYAARSNHGASGDAHGSGGAISAPVIGAAHAVPAHWHWLPGRYEMMSMQGVELPTATVYHDAAKKPITVVNERGVIQFDTLGNYTLWVRTHRVLAEGPPPVADTSESAVSHGRYYRRGDDVILYSGPDARREYVGRARVVERGIMLDLTVGAGTEYRPARFLFLARKGDLLSDGAHGHAGGDASGGNGALPAPGHAPLNGFPEHMPSW